MFRFRAARLAGCLALAAGVAAQGPGGSRAQTPPPVLDLWTWGRNNQGQLGQVPQNAGVPAPVHEPRRYVALSSSGDHTLALTDAGEVWAFGRNAEGQLGDGTTNDSFLPVRVGDLTGVTLVVAGTLHSLAYRDGDATLWAWGSNSSGQLARGPEVARSLTPVKIDIPAPLAAVASGSIHSLILTKEGAVYAWGPNEYGQLGTGDTAERRAPALVPLPERAIAVGAGGSHSAAVLASEGRVYTWGWNVFGQLGRGFQGTPGAGEPVPAPVPSVTGAAAVSLGDLHCLVRTADGHVWAWGYNTEGQVGNGEATPAYTGVLAPVLIDIEQVRSLDAGGLHSIAVKTNGEVWAWGNNQFAAVGNNSRADQRIPTRVVGLPEATLADAGGRHSVALAAPRVTTRLVDYGRWLGAAGSEARPAARTHSVPAGIAAASAGFTHGLVLDGEHRVWAFGQADHGQLGLPGGSREDPALVPLPLDGARGFVQVEARGHRSLALRSDGAVFSWGEGTWGALGLGTKDDVAAPARVALAEPVVRLAGGERHTLALDRAGAVWAFGENMHGELGVASPKLRLEPGRVPGLTSPSFIAAGAFHGLAVSISGALYAWGSGYRGQLGTGTRLDQSAVTEVRLPRDVVTVSAGRHFTLVVRNGGALSAFGDDSECQISGAPGGAEELSPRSLANLAPVLEAVAGDYHAAARTYDGGVVAWGNDSAGQLGRADSALSHYDCDRAPVMQARGVPVNAGATRTLIAAPPE